MMILLVSMSFGSGSINYGQATTAAVHTDPPILRGQCASVFFFFWEFLLINLHILTISGGPLTSPLACRMSPNEELLPFRKSRACVMICRPGSGQRINGKPNAFFIEHSVAFFSSIFHYVFNKRPFRKN